MQIRIKLKGMLKSKSPPGDVLDLPPPGTIATALDLLEISQETIQVFTVNGDLVRDRSRALAAGDELVVLPPVGGG